MLTVADRFTKVMFAQALKTNTPAEVAHRFDELVAAKGTPAELNSDEGTEGWGTKFQNGVNTLRKRSS